MPAPHDVPDLSAYAYQKGISSVLAYLMEAICDPENIEAALRAVVRNKGAPGVDGITVRQLPGVLKARWREIGIHPVNAAFDCQSV